MNTHVSLFCFIHLEFYFTEDPDMGSQLVSYRHGLLVQRRPKSSFVKLNCMFQGCVVLFVFCVLGMGWGGWVFV